MARVFKPSEGKQLGLPGRSSVEIVSGEKGARVTMRVVEIPVVLPGDAQRGPHFHSDTDEYIYVLSGRGTTYADSGEHALQAGDTILMPAGEKHVTRNTGTEPLLLLCFFPVAHLAKAAEEPPSPEAGRN